MRRIKFVALVSIDFANAESKDLTAAELAEIQATLKIAVARSVGTAGVDTPSNEAEKFSSQVIQG